MVSDEVSTPGFTFNFDTDSTVFQQVGKELSGRPGWKKSKTGDVKADVWLADGRKKNAVPYALLGQDPAKTQLVNYYRGSGCITLKSMMVRTLGSYLRDIGIDLFSILPLTFILYPRKHTQPMGQGGAEGLSAIAAAREKAKRERLASEDEREALVTAHTREKDAAGGSSPTWILKSSAGGKGEGITISRDVGELINVVDAADKETAWVVCRYLERPMLLSGRKFDLRCWVLLDPDYGMHMYQEGVLRTSSFEYDVSDLSNQLQHLTNHCVQATAAEFGSHEDGNELSFAEMEAYMAEECGGKTFFRDIMPEISRICALSLEAGREKMASTGNLKSFQLFGFDLMIDENYKVWLIEINGNPASREQLKEGIARGIVDVAILPQFGPSTIESASTSNGSSERFVPISSGGAK